MGGAIYPKKMCIRDRGIISRHPRQENEYGYRIEEYVLDCFILIQNPLNMINQNRQNCEKFGAVNPSNLLFFPLNHLKTISPFFQNKACDFFSHPPKGHPVTGRRPKSLGNVVIYSGIAAILFSLYFTIS